MPEMTVTSEEQRQILGQRSAGAIARAKHVAELDGAPTLPRWAPWRSCWLRLQRHSWSKTWPGYDRIWHGCTACGACRVAGITGPEAIFKG